MSAPTFDADGYPTDETIEWLSSWEITDSGAGLDFMAAAWRWPGFGVSHELRPCEREILDADPDERFLRLATGGWSGNEELVSAFMRSLASALTWRLRSSGGLWIFRYPTS